MSEIDDVLLELRDVGIRQLPEAGDAGGRRVRQALEEEMARSDRRFAWTGSKSHTGTTQLRSGGRSRAPRIRRSRLALAGAVAVAGLAVAGVLGFQGSGFKPSPALAATMHRLGNLAAGNLPGVPGPGQYLYTDLTDYEQIYTNPQDNSNSASDYPLGDGTNCIVLTVGDQQQWTAADGSGAIKDTAGQGQFTSAADQARCASLGVTTPTIGAPAGTVQTTHSGPQRNFTNDWGSLSSDPETLLGQIRQLDGGPNTPDTPYESFQNVKDLMMLGAPPAIRRALYDATALIPGVKMLGTQTDPKGQSGFGISLDDGNGRTEEMIFDPETGRLLADETFDDSTGQLVDWFAYTQQKIVNSKPPTP